MGKKEDDWESELLTMMEAGSSVINVSSYEWQRVHARISEIAEKIDLPIYVWSSAFGVRKMNNECHIDDPSSKFLDPIDLLAAFFDEKEYGPSILLLEDFHPYLEPNNFAVIRWLREFTRLPKSTRKHIVLLSPHLDLPRELQKDVPTIDVPYPDVRILRQMLEFVASEYNLNERRGEVSYNNSLLEAALGLTTMEAKRAFSKAAVLEHTITAAQVPLILEEKEQIIRNGKLLEFYHPSFTFNSVGGMNNLKKWLKKRGKGFGQEARSYGLEAPRGVLLLGIQGCGKSLTAKAIAQEWKLPLLRFDLGKVFAGIVGQSESNIREALKIAETLSPCILWIDEIEKGLSGVDSSNMTDGGTTSRVFGTILTWMQEKEKPVFVIATANDISKLPPEFLRKGRFDEIFFVDLPTESERLEIFKIHMGKKRPGLSSLDLTEFTKRTAGYSGAEIEEIVNEALYISYNEGGREIINEDVLEAIQNLTPLSSMMSEEISDLRGWATARTRMASSEPPEHLSTKQSESPRLKQEAKNPFMKPRSG